MSETKYIRNGKTISSIEKNENGTPAEIFSHKSINAAKKKSRELQISNDGSLGHGCLMLA